jgi:hypothetical protein
MAWGRRANGNTTVRKRTEPEGVDSAAQLQDEAQGPSRLRPDESGVDEILEGNSDDKAALNELGEASDPEGSDAYLVESLNSTGPPPRLNRNTTGEPPGNMPSPSGSDTLREVPSQSSEKKMAWSHPITVRPLPSKGWEESQRTPGPTALL